MTNTQADKLEDYLREVCPREISFPTCKSKMIMLEFLRMQDFVPLYDISINDALDLINHLCEVDRNG